MKQITQHNRTGEIRTESVPLPALKTGSILVRTRYSVISAGTERASLRQRKSSLIQKGKARPEMVLKILQQIKQHGLLTTYRRVKTQLESTAPLGYSLAGTVVAVGDADGPFKPGDRVACAGAGYANHAEYVLVPYNLCASVPDGVGLDEAAYTTIGAIALQGIRQAEPTLGETVVVIGLGLIGQLTVQMLKANGCAVVGIDLDAEAVKLARESGADVALRRSSGDARNVVRSFTAGAGADAVIVTAATPSSDPIELAAELCRDKGRIVLVGDVGMKLPRPPFFMKELDFRLSRSLGPGRYDPRYEELGIDYPIGYVRWTENRNMREFLRLAAEGAIDVRKLTTHRFAVGDAKKAFALILGRQSDVRNRYVGILLDYGEPEAQDISSMPRRTEVSPGKRGGEKVPVRLGFIGAGSFAQGFLLPHIVHTKGVALEGVCTANGLNAANVARNFGFRFSTTDLKEITGDDLINTVFIATRHNLHAPVVVAALRAGKNVFVEKPLALTAHELHEIRKAYDARVKKGDRPVLLVGFNRRFSPDAGHVKRFFENAVGPFVMNYRVNAGFVPPTHWTRDREVGGGRIIGEVCHFVDLMQFITGSVPVRVFAEPLSAPHKAEEDDSVSVTIKFADGSVGTIVYAANGDPSVPKERLEISSTGRSAVIDNFQTLSLFQEGKRRDFKRSKVEKGHREEVQEFLTAVQSGEPSPISFDSVATTTAATFKIVESLQLGAPVSL